MAARGEEPVAPGDLAQEEAHADSGPNTWPSTDCRGSSCSFGGDAAADVAPYCRPCAELVQALWAELAAR